MNALTTPVSPLSFEAAMAMGQTGRFYPSSSTNAYRAKPTAAFNQDNDEEDWC